MGFFDNFRNYKDRLYKKEAPKEEFDSYFERLDLENFFNFMNNVYDPSSMLYKFGGRRSLEKLYYDPEIFSAWDKRQSAILDTRPILKDGDDAVREFMEKQILPHQRQLKQDIQWSNPYGYSVIQIIYNEDRSGNVDGYQREQFWRFEPQQDLIHVKLINSDNPGMINRLMPYGKWVLITNNGTYFNPFGEASFERILQPWLWSLLS